MTAFKLPFLVRSEQEVLDLCTSAGFLSEIPQSIWWLFASVIVLMIIVIIMYFMRKDTQKVVAEWIEVGKDKGETNDGSKL